MGREFLAGTRSVEDSVGLELIARGVLGEEDVGHIVLKERREVYDTK